MATESAAELSALIQAGDTEGIRMALDAPGVRKLLYRSSPNGEYPIIVAARTKQNKIVELLLISGANPNQESEEKGSHLGYTAAHYAAANGDMEMLHTLTQFKADVNRSSADKWTPLHVAAYKGRTPVMEFLIKKGADVNCRNNLGQTPILFSVSHGRIGDVRLLVKNAADLKYKDLNNETLLHHALHFLMSKMLDGQYDVPEAQLDIAVVLVIHGVPPGDKNLDGQEAAFYLKQKLPSLPEALDMMSSQRDRLLVSSTELNYLTLVLARQDQLLALGLSEDAALSLCSLFSKLESERLAARNSSTVHRARAIGGVSVGKGHPGAAPVAVPTDGSDPSGGKCPFFQKNREKLPTNTADDRDRACCPFSFTFVRRHRSMLMLCFSSFIFGMCTGKMLDRLLSRQ